MLLYIVFTTFDEFFYFAAYFFYYIGVSADCVYLGDCKQVCGTVVHFSGMRNV